MAEFSWPWQGSVTGDAASAPWDEDQISDIIKVLFTLDAASFGVLRRVMNELEVTNPSGLTINVDTGGAIVYGSPYKSDEVVAHTLNAAPGANTDYYEMVLGKSWASKNVRSYLIGPINAAAPLWPPLTQVPGTTYEIRLAYISQTSLGVITVTDDRAFASANLAGVPRLHHRNGDRDSYDWFDRADWLFNLMYSQPIEVHHNTMMQCGCAEWTGVASSSGQLTITYPEPYSFGPIFLVTAFEPTPDIVFTVTHDPSAPHSWATVTWNDILANTHTSIKFFWVAVGPIVTRT